MIQLKTQATRHQSKKCCLEINICRLCGGMMTFAGYSNAIAHIDYETKEKIYDRTCPNSNISLLVSRSDMPNMRCFSIGGTRNQHGAIVKFFVTTAEIIISLTPLLFPSLFSPTPKTLIFHLFSTLFNLRNSFSVRFWPGRKIALIEIILSQILTKPQNAHQWKYSKSNYDLGAKPP